MRGVATLGVGGRYITGALGRVEISRTARVAGKKARAIFYAPLHLARTVPDRV